LKPTGGSPKVFKRREKRRREKREWGEEGVGVGTKAGKRFYLKGGLVRRRLELFRSYSLEGRREECLCQ